MLNEKAVPAVRDGGAFTAVRGYEGNATRGIQFSTTFVRSYDGEFEKLDKKWQLTYGCNRGGLIPFNMDFSRKGFDFDRFR